MAHRFNKTIGKQRLKIDATVWKFVSRLGFRFIQPENLNDFKISFAKLKIVSVVQ